MNHDEEHELRRLLSPCSSHHLYEDNDDPIGFAQSPQLILERRVLTGLRDVRSSILACPRLSWLVDNPAETDMPADRPAQLINDFLESLDRCIWFQETHPPGDFIALDDKPFPPERKEFHRRAREVQKNVRSKGEVLASLLEGQEQDSTNLLKLLEFTGSDDRLAGSEVLLDVTAQLKRLLIQLREKGVSPVEVQEERCAVELFGEEEPPVVFGKKKSILTGRRYEIVKALVDVWPARLTSGQLKDRTEYSQPGKPLRALSDKDSDWKRAILRPPGKGDGYGLAAR